MECEYERFCKHEGYKQLMRLMLHDFSFDIFNSHITKESTIQEVHDFVNEWTEKHFERSKNDDSVSYLVNRETGMRAISDR